MLKGTRSPIPNYRRKQHVFLEAVSSSVINGICYNLLSRSQEPLTVLAVKEAGRKLLARWPVVSSRLLQKTGRW